MAGSREILRPGIWTNRACTVVARSADAVSATERITHRSCRSASVTVSASRTSCPTFLSTIWTRSAIQALVEPGGFVMSPGLPRTTVLPKLSPRLRVVGSAEVLQGAGLSRSPATISTALSPSSSNGLRSIWDGSRSRQTDVIPRRCLSISSRASCRLVIRDATSSSHSRPRWLAPGCSSRTRANRHGRRSNRGSRTSFQTFDFFQWPVHARLLMTRCGSAFSI